MEIKRAKGGRGDFPEMSPDEFGALVADIRENGLLEPIWLCGDGRIIDGRNRYRACQEADVEPEYRTYTGDGSLVSFVVGLNIRRRHLTQSQKATLAVALEPMFAEEARGRQGTRTDIQPKLAGSENGQARDFAATTVGVGRSYVSYAKRLKHEDSDMFERVACGERTLQDAKRAIKARKREEHRAENAAKVAAVQSVDDLVGSGAKFSTIVIDPPWDWGYEGDKDQFGRAAPAYKTMPNEEVAALPMCDLADTDSHIYLWITNRSLPKGFELLESWGFRYITCLTWCKPSFGMGNYFRGSTEHVLFGVKGSQPLKRKDVGTWFAAPRGKGGHSSKPVEFMELVESCSPGPYLEMFARSEREGWSAWGAEA